MKTEKTAVSRNEESRGKDKAQAYSPELPAKRCKTAVDVALATNVQQTSCRGQTLERTYSLSVLLLAPPPLSLSLSLCASLFLSRCARVCALHGHLPQRRGRECTWLCQKCIEPGNRRSSISRVNTSPRRRISLYKPPVGCAVEVHSAAFAKC